jgi:hypothetical protein
MKQIVIAEMQIQPLMQRGIERLGYDLPWGSDRPFARL